MKTAITNYLKSITNVPFKVTTRPDGKLVRLTVVFQHGKSFRTGYSLVRRVLQTMDVEVLERSDAGFLCQYRDKKYFVVPITSSDL